MLKNAKQFGQQTKCRVTFRVMRTSTNRQLRDTARRAFRRIQQWWQGIGKMRVGH